MNRRILALLVLVATPAAAYDRLPAALADRSPAHFAEQIRVVDDPHEAAILISTQEGHTRGRALKGARADDVHLRALIDRRSGAVTWQVWHDLAYVGSRKRVETIHYAAGGEPREARPIHVEHRLDRCPATDQPGQCNQAMTVGFELPETAVREIAAAYAPGSRDPWPLRFRDAHGRDVTGGLAPAEAAGILRAVEKWRRGQS